MGHAGTDFEIEWRSIEELVALEASDPLLRSAAIALESGLYTREEILDLYERTRARCFEAAEQADGLPKLETLEEIVRRWRRTRPTRCAPRPSAPISTRAVSRSTAAQDKLPEKQPPRHLAIQINQALHELMAKYDQALVFGEDVAQKGGVYTVTKGLYKAFRGARVFNTLLDETTILGLAQGYANLGFLPIPEIQYLAYLHNAIDQIRGEASSLQFFSNDQYRNPMVMRVASLGYQKGFGGHFHNDNSITALRDIPGLVVGCPSRGDDAVTMLRTLMALAKVDGRVCAFLEPIALYMTKDLHEAGDGAWQFAYPAPGQAMTPGRGARLRTRGRGPGGVHLRQRRADGLARGAGASRRRTAGRCAWSTCAGWCRSTRPSSPNRRRMRGASWCSTRAVTAPGVGEGIVTALVEAGLRCRRRCAAWSVPTPSRRWPAPRCACCRASRTWSRPPPRMA